MHVVSVHALALAVFNLLMGADAFTYQRYPSLHHAVFVSRHPPKETKRFSRTSPCLSNELLDGTGIPSKPGWESGRLLRLTRWAGSKAANRPVICEYNPSSLWLWFKWKGTVMKMIYPAILISMGCGIAIDLWARRVTKTAGWNILSVPPATDPLIQSLSGLGKLWSYMLTICTFMLTFFASQAYSYWQKVYNTCRIIQGRINDYCMLLTASAEREVRLMATGDTERDDDSTVPPTITGMQFTERSFKLVQKCTRLIRMAHIFFWAATPTASNGLTDNEEFLEEAEDCPIPIEDINIGPLLLSPFGLKALVNTGQLTRGEVEYLGQTGLFPTQYSSVLLEWVGAYTMEGLRDKVLTGKTGFEGNILQQLTSLRAAMYDIDDFRAGRMPLAYVQLVQVLVDALLLLAPFSLFPELGSLSILLVGLLALFFRGLLTLSKSFLDPFGVEGFGEQNIRVDVLVSEINFGASKRWIQAGNWLPVDKEKLEDLSKQAS